MANLLMFMLENEGERLLLEELNLFFEFSNVANIQPTVVSSSREKHLTIPAFLKSASTAESLEAIAPVCDEAAHVRDARQGERFRHRGGRAPHPQVQGLPVGNRHREFQ